MPADSRILAQTLLRPRKLRRRAIYVGLRYGEVGKSVEKLQQTRSRMHITPEGESLRLIGAAVARALAGCSDAELDDREAVGRRVLEELRLRGFVLIEAQPSSSAAESLASSLVIAPRPA